MTTLRILRDASVAGGILLALGAAQDYFVCRPNRAAIIGAMHDLRLGMTREEVATVLKRHNALRLERGQDPQGVHLMGQAGLARWWQLGIVFQEGQLRSAKVWTEDGPYHPSGVPADILPGPGPAPSNLEREQPPGRE